VPLILFLLQKNSSCKQKIVSGCDYGEGWFTNSSCFEHWMTFIPSTSSLMKNFLIESFRYFCSNNTWKIFAAAMQAWKIQPPKELKPQLPKAWKTQPLQAWETQSPFLLHRPRPKRLLSIPKMFPTRPCPPLWIPLGDVPVVHLQQKQHCCVFFPSSFSLPFIRCPTIILHCGKQLRCSYVSNRAGIWFGKPAR